MILTDYYNMKELKPMKSHRFDCIASTGEYEPFEVIAVRARDKHLHVYFTGVPDGFSADAQRRADMAITNTNNISSVFVPDMEQPLMGYGDTHGTNDGLLFLFSSDYKQMEIFVARGYKHNIKSLFNLFLDGELNGEIEQLRKRAISTMILPEQ